MKGNKKMKTYKFPVRDIGLNPFLTNPVQAVIQNGTRKLDGFYIQHCLETNQGLEVFGRYDFEPSNTYRCLNMKRDNVVIANKHEASRFETMLEMLKIKL